MSHPFIDEIRCAINQGPLLAPGQGVVVAVSGGADSVGMLHGLRRLDREEGWGLRLTVAHLNHGLRGAEADADEGFVRQLAEGLGLAYRVERTDVGRLAEQKKLSLETAAREARYDFLARCARDEKAERVAVGHTADDQAETVLFRVVRGTGLRGLAGMAPSRVLEGGPEGCRLVRPLLNVRRQAILDYLKTEGLSWREDASNQDPVYSRNVLRHEIIPKLAEQLNPQVVEALARLACLAGQTQDFVDRESRALFGRIAQQMTKTGLTLDAEELSGTHSVLQAEVIRLAVTELGGGMRELDQATLERIAELVTGSGAVDTATGIRAERTAEGLRLSSAPPAPPEPFCHAVAVPGRTELPGIGATVHVEEVGNALGLLDGFVANKSRTEEMMDRDRLRGDLFVRSRRDGDRIVPLGMTGTRKLQDLLVDLKVDVRQRDRVPILCDADGPVWVIPYRLAERVRVRPATKRVLRVSLEATEDYMTLRDRGAHGNEPRP